MRSRNALRGMVSSLLLQFVTMVCGILLPRLFIGTYGSAVNGTAASITQFLGYIALFEAGVGGVVRAALYRPLAQNNLAAVSSILRATDRFFRRIACIFVLYAVVIGCVFPLFVRKDFDFLFTFLLVLIIALSTFSQYFFGMSRQVLLQADQKRYITSDLQILTVILNTALSVLLIRLHAPVHMVKLGTAVIYALRPIVLRVYVYRKYKPDPNAVPDTSAIAQRWDGFGHHTAYFLHTNTDVFVLTVFSGFVSSLQIADVSVYTVYYSIVSGVEKIVAAFSSGVEAAFGNMIAREETQTLQKNFAVYEYFSFTLTTLLFTCAGILLQPFIAVYTHGITDAQYARPAFGILLTLAEAVYCIRIPYNNVTLAAGHYRQTRNGAFIEAGINIVLSLVLVVPLGLEGVALATLAAMVFRTIQYAVYLSGQILHRSILYFFRRCAIAGLTAGLTVFIHHLLPASTPLNYLQWALYGIRTAAICGILLLASSLLFDRPALRVLWAIFKNSIKTRSACK